MAHQASHRRTLAAPHPHPHPTPMDPAPKRHPKPSPFTTTTAAAAAAKNHHQPIHPLPDPTTTAPPSTIQAISHRFSKLYTHHKKLMPNSLKPQQPNPQLSNPSILDSSCSTLSKSSSVKERHHHDAASIHLKTKVKEKDDIKKKHHPHSSSKTAHKRATFEEFDVKKASQLMSKSLGSEGMKGFQDGLVDGVRGGRISLSSIPPPVNGGGGGRRRSFCSSQVELGDFLSSNGVKIVAVDMPPFMQIHAVDCARKAHDSLEKFTSKTLAFTLKKEFDGVYGPAWHCIVGTSFGSFVTHSVGGFIYFSMDHKLYVLLFKTTVQRAE